MDFILFCAFFGFVVKVAESQDCTFRLDGTQHLVFEFDRMNLSTTTDFKLRVKTTQANTLLYFVEGQRREGVPLDYEGVFIRDGKLNYFMFNPSELIAGSSHGGHVETDFTVNGNTLIEIEFFRNKLIAHKGDGSDTVRATGMRISGGGLRNVKEVTEIGAIPEMSLFSSPGKVRIYIGGHPDIRSVSRYLNNLDGEISGLKDQKSDTYFGSPHTASSYVSNSCDRTPA